MSAKPVAEDRANTVPVNGGRATDDATDTRLLDRLIGSRCPYIFSTAMNASLPHTARLRAILILTDGTSLALAVYCAHHLRFADPWRKLKWAELLASPGLLLWSLLAGLVLAAAAELYQPEILHRRREVAVRVAAVIGGWMTSVVLAAYFLSSGAYGRGVLALTAAIWSLLLIASRWTLTSWLYRRQRLSALVAGDPAAVRRFCRDLEARPRAPWAPLDGSATELHDVPAAIERHGASIVVLAGSDEHGLEMDRDLARLQLSGVPAVAASEVWARLEERLPLEALSPAFFRHQPGFGTVRRRLFHHLTRLADIVLATVMLVLSTPLLLLAMLLVWLADGRPVLYRQQHVGMYGRRFTTWKLRTMERRAEPNGAGLRVEKRSRIPGIGRLLWRCRLEGLPQLLNVLKGEMSLVGPRPEQPSLVARLSDEIPYYAFRTAVPPGISGWAQVHAPYASNLAGHRRELEYDLYFIRERSMRLYLLTLLRVVSAALAGVWRAPDRSYSGSAEAPLPATSRQTSGRLWLYWLIPFLLLIALRIPLALSQESPQELDELGYLGNARYLATGSGLVDPVARAAYKVGYSLLLIPAFLWTSDGALGYTLALLISAAAIAIVHPLVFVLTGQLRPDLPPFDRMLIALVTSVYPAIVLYGTSAMSFNAFVPSYLLFLVLCHRVQLEPRLWHTFALGAISAYLYWVHERALGILVIALTLVPAYQMAKRRKFLATGSLYLGAALVLGASSLLTVPGTEYRTLDKGSSILQKIAGLDDIALEIVGQSWYAMVATAGLILLGALTALLNRPLRELSFRHRGFFWLIVLGTGSSAIAMSVLFMSRWSSTRFTYLIYGRYNEAVLVPLLALALASLHPGRRHAGTLKALPAGCLAGLAIWGLIGLLVAFRDRILAHDLYLFNVPALYAPASIVGWSPVKISALAGALAVLLGLAFAWRWRAGTVLAGVVFLSCSAISYDRFWQSRSHDRTAQRSLVTVIAEAAPAGNVVLYDTATAWPNFHFYNYSFFLHPYGLQRVEIQPGQQPTGELVLTPEAALDRLLPDARLVSIESIPRLYGEHQQYLWSLPGRLQQDLTARGWVFPRNCANCLAEGASRSELKASAPRSGPYRLSPGGSEPLWLEVTNRGTSPWPSSAALRSGPGSVQIGLTWKNRDSGEQRAEARVDLPYVLHPGRTAVVRCVLRAVDSAGRPLAPGRYEVTIGLVHIGQYWFRERGDDTLTLAAEVT